MNLKRQVILMCGTALMSVGGIAMINSFSGSDQESAQQTTVALTQKIAQVEIEKLLQGVKFTAEAPQMVQLREQQSHLEKRLAQLQPDSSQHAIAIATANYIRAKITDLEVQHAQDKAKFIDIDPRLQVQKEQIEVLRQRLNTLKQP